MLWKSNVYYIQTAIIKTEKFNKSSDDGQLKKIQKI